MKKSFEEVCSIIGSIITSCEDDDAASVDELINLQKRAIIGYYDDVKQMKARISSVIALQSLTFDIPTWYRTKEDAVFHEIWGLAGMAEWFSDDYADSSSAKIIGERIYFMHDGIMRLMPQKIAQDRREQLIRALLMMSPEERLDREFHEIYMLDGTRVTIFRAGLSKKGLDTIIFRRYIVPIYSFDEQASRGTIPKEAIPLFEDMVQLGYNVVFCGSVRSAKTTFLSTWQSYEDPTLEGVMVETDPEIPIHKLMPNAPVVQLIADGDSLRHITKNLMRSDADYFILAEARDGLALDTAVRIARRGTRRMKMTFHTRDPRAFAEDAAVEIVREFGGDIEETALRTAGSFDYIFHFADIRSRNEKKLRGIYELSVEDGTISTECICGYEPSTDRWSWRYHIGEEKRKAGEDENHEVFLSFSDGLRRLAETEGDDL